MPLSRLRALLLLALCLLLACVAPDAVSPPQPSAPPSNAPSVDAGTDSATDPETAMGRIIIRRRDASPPEIPEDKFVVCVGDSLTYGTGASDPGGTPSYPGQLAAELGLTYGTDVINLGVPSLGVEDLPDPDWLLATPAAAGKQAHLVIDIGVNNGFPADWTADDIWDVLAPWIEEREAVGWIVHVCTWSGNNLVDPDGDTEAVAFRALVLANAAHPIDIASDPTIGAAAGGLATHYDGDGLHLNDTGYTHKASLIAPPIAATDGPAPPSLLPAFGYVPDEGLTGYWRDWRAVSPADPALEVDPEFYSLAAKSIETRKFVASGTFADRELNAVNGHFAIDLNGTTDFYTTGGGLLWSDFISSSAASLRMVVYVKSIANNNTTNRNLNDGLLGDSENNILLYVRDSGSPKVGFWIWDSGDKYVETTIPLEQWVIVEAKVDSNHLYIRVGSGGEFVESAMTVGVVTRIGQPRLGRNGGSAYAAIKVAQFSFRDDTGNAVRSAYNASDVARYGL